MNKKLTPGSNSNAEGHAHHESAARMLLFPEAMIQMRPGRSSDLLLLLRLPISTAVESVALNTKETSELTASGNVQDFPSSLPR